MDLGHVPITGKACLAGDDQGGYMPYVKVADQIRTLRGVDDAVGHVGVIEQLFYNPAVGAGLARKQVSGAVDGGDALACLRLLRTAFFFVRVCPRNSV